MLLSESFCHGELHFRIHSLFKTLFFCALLIFLVVCSIFFSLFDIFHIQTDASSCLEAREEKCKAGAQRSRRTEQTSGGGCNLGEVLMSFQCPL